ncbi:MAG: TlpA family protein disulfide reductase [Bacteroidetes bacterium]|nr:TlpA family protein disulfide reductase [Bacteroidota bacterium]
MRTFIVGILICLMALSGSAQDNHPVSWRLSSTSTWPLTFEVKFIASIKEPFHIYPQSFAGGIGMPTTISFETNDNVELTGEMKEKGDEIPAGEEAAFYKKGVTFSQMIRLKADVKTTIHVRIKYMACNDQMCLPPSSKEYTLILNDKNPAAAESHNETKDATANTSGKELKYEDFVMADTGGKNISTREITTSHSYTFIDFWASWCGPCRSQATALVPLYRKYSTQGLAVIGVSLDTDVRSWRKAIGDDGYTWTNLSDLKGFDSPISLKYGIKAIPRNLIVNNKGEIVAMDLHGKELETKLAELFK